MRYITSLFLVLALSGCCDRTCDCRQPAQDALIRANQALASVGAIVSDRVSPAGQAALLVLNDPAASQDRKSQALQLLFELERSRGLESTAKHLDELSARLQVLLERKVEADDR